MAGIDMALLGACVEYPSKLLLLLLLLLIFVVVVVYDHDFAGTQWLKRGCTRCISKAEGVVMIVIAIDE